MTRLLLAASVALLLAAAVYSEGCGSDSQFDSGVAPVAEIGCTDLVCTLLVWNASEVRVYDTVDPNAYHMWEDYQGYLDERRLTYRFPLPPTGVALAEACNPEGVCTTVESTED